MYTKKPRVVIIIDHLLTVRIFDYLWGKMITLRKYLVILIYKSFSNLIYMLMKGQKEKPSK